MPWTIGSLLIPIGRYRCVVVVPTHRGNISIFPPFFCVPMCARVHIRHSLVEIKIDHNFSTSNLTVAYLPRSLCDCTPLALDGGAIYCRCCRVAVRIVRTVRICLIIFHHNTVNSSNYQYNYNTVNSSNDKYSNNTVEYSNNTVVNTQKQIINTIIDHH